MDCAGITKIATDAADLIYEMAQPVIADGMNLRFQYSPESFMGTEMDYAVEICGAVLDHLHADADHKVILNLPTTVENCMPNQLADMLEYFIRNLPGRERAIISLHPHNDRGTGVATTEMGLLAGAERVEATLFGHLYITFSLKHQYECTLFVAPFRAQRRILRFQSIESHF